MGGYPGKAVSFSLGFAFSFSITFRLPISVLPSWDSYSDANTVRSTVEKEDAGVSSPLRS